MSKYKVGIVGCGAILPRHLESIDANNNFELSAICDIQEDLVKNLSKNPAVNSWPSKNLYSTETRDAENINPDTKRVI